MYTLNDFDYALPEQLIAQFPTKNRIDSRLLIIPNNNTDFIHEKFLSILNYINPNDLIIFNDTRVIPARLFGVKKSGGKIECLIERVLNDHQALAHIRASHAPKIGCEIVLEDALHATVVNRCDGLFHLKFDTHTHTLFELLKKYGKIPLPPYIMRETKTDDCARYQTVYAKNQGAVAAPTAGLHFDDNILSVLKNKNVDIGFLTLHVGAGTFQPVRVEHIKDHVMHGEMVTVSVELLEKIEACKKRGGRVIAVGTTVVRALESAAQFSSHSNSFETKIFITPGFKFKVVDMLLTNFHLPKSTLLMLVCAFGGYERVMQAYKIAVEEKYRFFSYGDAMLLYRDQVSVIGDQ